METDHRTFMSSLKEAFPDTTRFQRIGTQPLASSDALSAIERDIADVENLLQETINTFHGSLVHLRSRRNNAVTVNILPDEILCAVFETANDQGFDHKTTLAISHTCARWRSVSLADASFWSCIDMNAIPLKLAKLYLEQNTIIPRSLVFICDGYEDPVLEKAKLCADITVFARELVLCTRIPISWLAPPSEAPFLEIFTLDGINIRNSGPIISDPFASYPRLHSLTLREVLLPKHSSAYRGLRELSIEVCTTASEKFNFFSLLSASPDLQVLNLSIREMDNVFENLAENEWLKLTQLRSLSLVLPIVEINEVLSSLEIPPGCRMDLRVPPTCMTTEKASLIDFFPVDPRFLSRLQDSYKLCIKSRYSQAIIYKSESPRSFPESLPRVESLPFITLSSVGNIFDSTSIIGLLQLLSSLQDLELGSCSAYSASDIIIFMKLVPALRRLRIDWCPIELYKTLTTLVEYSPTPFLPRLSHIVLCHSKINTSLTALCRSLEKQLCSIQLVGCRFETMTEEERILGELQGLDILEVMSSNATYRKRL
ncbi:unnamed protein product [Somion occarium]